MTRLSRCDNRVTNTECHPAVTHDPRPVPVPVFTHLPLTANLTLWSPRFLTLKSRSLATVMGQETASERRQISTETAQP